MRRISRYPYKIETTVLKGTFEYVIRNGRVIGRKKVLQESLLVIVEGNLFDGIV